MPSDTPIFDQLVDEFNASGMYEFGFVYEKTPAVITPEAVKEGISFLANLGEVLAQEEPEIDSTQAMDVVAEFQDDEPTTITNKTLYDATNLSVIKPAIPEIIKLPHQSVTDVLKEADEELGLDNFDKAFEVAAKTLEPAPKSNVTPLVMPGRLPQRNGKRNRNKKSRTGGNANKSAGSDTHHFSFFETDTISSPESAA